MGSFTVKNGSVDRITRQIVSMKDVVGDGIERKVQLVTDIIYKTAKARRPKISVQQHKAMGRKVKTKAGKSVYRVSDPNAKLGVPVDTGALQASIKKSVTRNGDKTTGEISAGNGQVPYAAMIEFGTSKMAARPYMRPAINENSELIKRIFTKKIDKI